MLSKLRQNVKKITTKKIYYKLEYDTLGFHRVGNYLFFYKIKGIVLLKKLFLVNFPEIDVF